MLGRQVIAERPSSNTQEQGYRQSHGAQWHAEQDKAEDRAPKLWSVAAVANMIDQQGEAGAAHGIARIDGAPRNLVADLA